LAIVGCRLEEAGDRVPFLTANYFAVTLDIGRWTLDSKYPPAIADGTDKKSGDRVPFLTVDRIVDF
jgi:hypothetical protein